jgi:hypothetical protein
MEDVWAMAWLVILRKVGVVLEKNGGRGQAGSWLGCHVPEPWKLGEYMRSSACSRGLSVVDFVVASVVLRHLYSKHLLSCCCRILPSDLGKQHSHLLYRFPHLSAGVSKTELAN